MAACLTYLFSDCLRLAAFQSLGTALGRDTMCSSHMWFSHRRASSTDHVYLCLSGTIRRSKASASSSIAPLLEVSPVKLTPMRFCRASGVLVHMRFVPLYAFALISRIQRTISQYSQPIASSVSQVPKLAIGFPRSFCWENHRHLPSHASWASFSSLVLKASYQLVEFRWIVQSIFVDQSRA